MIIPFHSYAVIILLADLLVSLLLLIMAEVAPARLEDQRGKLPRRHAQRQTLIRQTQKDAAGYETTSAAQRLLGHNIDDSSFDSDSGYSSDKSIESTNYDELEEHFEAEGPTMANLSDRTNSYVL
jgi:hypothetical protein